MSQQSLFGPKAPTKRPQGGVKNRGQSTGAVSKGPERKAAPPRQSGGWQDNRPAPPAAPLAERMRPRSLDQVLGQAHLLGPEKPLRLLAESSQLSSILLWGPPGTGKTTLARILANRAGYHFHALSAVMAGVKDVREVIADAKIRHRGGARTVLFLDEIHRFNKAQQDALLPHVESGLVTLIGATTENPSFEVNAALLSRMTVYRLKGLGPKVLEALIWRALDDIAHGLGGTLKLTPEAIAALARQGDGDARRTLVLLEQLQKAARQLPKDRGPIDAELVGQLLQLQGPRYDKGGDDHYNVISAFIKSMRGSDPDAAVYYMARMLESGESARFIVRRMIVFASEDIGNADPMALQVAVQTAQAVEHVGLPEAAICMAQGVTYLSTAPKSNAAYMALKAAKAEVKASRSLPIPLKLCNAPTQLMKDEGYGEGYAYPHDHPGHFYPTAYLPDALAGRRFYEPSDQGREQEIGKRLSAWRQAVVKAKGKGK